MKKLFISTVSIIACACMTYAQNDSDCSYLFPDTKGTTLTTQCYDAQNNLLGTTTYIVTDETENYFGSSSEIRYSMKDNSGNILNAGIIENVCNDGNVYIKTKSQADMDDITGTLSANINLMGSFLDYPDTFDPYEPFNGAFNQGEAELTLKVKDENRKPVRVRIYNRSYEKNEPIHTPAGTFDASKISFMVDVYDGDDKTTKTYKTVEWYSMGKGILRAEAYDENDQLLNYTVLTAMNDKK